MKKKYLFLVSLVVVIPFISYAQIGGRYAYSFLEKPVSARVAALGGNQAAINDNDINIGYVNPSLITPAMSNAISLAYVNFFTGINYGLAQYARSFKKAGSFVASMQYVNYGQFKYANQNGNQSGTFGASDMALTVGWGRRLDSSFSIGANAKMIYSHYESYSSYGLAVDVAGSYKTKTGWIMSLIASNAGIQLKGYLPGQRDPLPLNVQYALSKRLSHVPFRISLIYDHLERWNLAYDNPSNPPGGFDPITGKPIPLNGISRYSDNFLRHFIVGGELYIGKNLVLRGSYNYRRRQELKIDDRMALVGFSWGMGIRISRFQINYSRSTYHLQGSPNYFTITTSLDKIKK